MSRIPTITLREDPPDPDAYYRLFQTTGWNIAYAASKAELVATTTSSWFTLSAYDEDDELVGFGRIVSEGKLYAFVCDMIVTPEHQRKGIGGMIMEAMIERCREAGIRVMWLFCASGKVEFYRKHGFEERPSEAPGMQLNLNLRT